jgi:hypothetical protein
MVRYFGQDLFGGFLVVEENRSPAYVHSLSLKRPNEVVG